MVPVYDFLFVATTTTLHVLFLVESSLMKSVKSSTNVLLHAVPPGPYYPYLDYFLNLIGENLSINIDFLGSPVA